VRALLIVVISPLLDGDARLDPIAKPLDRQALVAKLPDEGFIRAVLPRLARVDEGRLDGGGNRRRIAVATNSGPLSERR